MAVRMQVVIDATTSSPTPVGEGDRCYRRVQPQNVSFHDQTNCLTEKLGVIFLPSSKCSHVQDSPKCSDGQDSSKCSHGQDSGQIQKKADSNDILARTLEEAEVFYLDKREHRTVGWGEPNENCNEGISISSFIRNRGQEEELTTDVCLVSTEPDDHSTNSAVVDIPSDQFWSELSPTSRSNESANTTKPSELSMSNDATKKAHNAVSEITQTGLTVAKMEIVCSQNQTTRPGNDNKLLGEPNQMLGGANQSHVMPDDVDCSRTQSHQSLTEDYKNFINGNDIIKLSDSFLAEKTFMSASCKVKDGFLNLKYIRPASVRGKRTFERFRLKSVNSFRSRLNMIKDLQDFNTDHDYISIFNESWKQPDYEVRGHSVTQVKLSKRNITGRTNSERECGQVQSHRRPKSCSNDSSLRLDTDFDAESRSVRVPSIRAPHIDRNNYFKTKTNDSSRTSTSKQASTTKCSRAMTSGRCVEQQQQLCASLSEWSVLTGQQPRLTFTDTTVKHDVKDAVRMSKLEASSGNEELFGKAQMIELPREELWLLGVKKSAEGREFEEHESEISSQTKRRPDSSSRGLGELFETPRSATGGNGDRFDRGDCLPCFPGDAIIDKQQDVRWHNQESNRVDNLSTFDSKDLCTEEIYTYDKSNTRVESIFDDGKTEISLPESKSEKSSFSKMWPNPWDWPTPVPFERPKPTRQSSFRDVTFTGMTIEDIKKAKERSKRSQEEFSNSVSVSEEKTKTRPWNDYLLSKFNRVGGQKQTKKTMKFKLTYDDTNCECTLIPCPKSGQTKTSADKTGNSGLDVDSCNDACSESKTDTTLQQRRVTVRMRKVLPPPQPRKLCFQTMLSGCTHSEVKQELETQANVKVTLIQYDPIRLQAFKNSSITEEHCCMWIFELSPNSNAEHLLFEGVNLRGLHMNVRPLDDVYREEHMAYTLCTEIYSEQQKKRLTQKCTLKFPRACRKRFSFK